MSTRFKTDHDFLRRMNEPEKLKQLRRQKDQLEQAREDALRGMMAEQEAEAIRGEIRRMGQEPCA